MDNYLVKRISCIVLSLLLTLSLAVSFFSLTGVLLLRNSSFMLSKIETYTEQFKQVIDSEIIAETDGEAMPAEYLAQAVDEGAMEYILSVTAKNAAHGNANDFSFDSTLYSRIYANLINIAKTQGIKVSDAELADLASLEVDVVSSVMSQVDTKDVLYISLFRSRIAGIIVLAGAVTAAGAVILITVINSGRHRKNSYIGMGFACAGFVDISASVAMLLTGFGENTRFCTNSALNSAAADALKSVVLLQIVFGIVFVIIGYAVLALNYRYFSRKNDNVKRENEVKEKMRADYMRHYESKNTPRPEPVAGEREEMKIDF